MSRGKKKLRRQTDKQEVNVCTVWTRLKTGCLTPRTGTALIKLRHTAAPPPKEASLVVSLISANRGVGCHFIIAQNYSETLKVFNGTLENLSMRPATGKVRPPARHVLSK